MITVETTGNGQANSQCMLLVHVSLMKTRLQHQVVVVRWSVCQLFFLKVVAASEYLCYSLVTTVERPLPDISYHPELLMLH